MSENPYPEHLNPFAEVPKPKRKPSLGSSFREFTKTVRRSFRIKKKPDDHVEYRKRRDDYSGGQTSRLPPVRPHTEAPVAYPRSRFQDRLTLRNARYSDEYNNPFEEGESAHGLPPQPAIRRNKGKKKAPLPPKSISSQNVTDLNESDGHRNASNWSLTSADTDYTYSTENLSERDLDDKVSLSENVTKELQNFNKEMEKLNEDSNNNNNIISQPESVKNIHNIPDLVVTCPNSDSDNEHRKEDVQEEKREDEGNNNNNNNIDNKIEERDKTDEDEDDDDEELVIKDVTENLRNPDSVSTDSDLPFHFNERKSIFIEGSTDQLDSDKYAAERILYIDGSKEELDNCNNNDANLEQDVAADNSAHHPEKHRKTKLTRDSLLGTAT